MADEKTPLGAPAKKQISWGPVVLSLIIGVVVGIGLGSSHDSKPAAPDSQSGAPSDNSGSTQPTPNNSTPQTLLEISGNGTKSTQSFTAGGEWDLTYSYDCSGFGQQGNFIISIQSASGGMSGLPPVNQLGRSGSDVEHYHSGGRYFLEVNSECSWNIKVVG